MAERHVAESSEIAGCAYRGAAVLAVAARAGLEARNRELLEEGRC